MKLPSNLCKAAAEEKNNKWVWLLLAVFVYICRSYIPTARAAGLSLAEYVLLIMSNHYYAVYGLGIYVICRTSVLIRADGSLTLVRCGAYRRYYAAKLSVLGMRIMLPVAAHILTAFTVGIICGLEISNRFAGSLAHGESSDTLRFVVMFGQYFDTPAEAVCAVSLYLIMGLFFICELIYFAHEISGFRATLFLMFVIMADILLGFKLHIDESWLEIFFLNNYFILHHPLFLVSPAAVFADIAVVMFGSPVLRYITISVKRGDAVRRRKRDGYIEHNFGGTWKAALLFSAALTAIGVAPQLISDGAWQDCAFALTAGFSKSGINLISLLYYLAAFIFPIFAVDAFYEKVKADRTILARFRYGNRRKWRFGIARSCVCFLVRYFLIFCGVQACAVLTVRLLRGDVRGDVSEVLAYYGASDGEFAALAALSVVLRFMELMVLYVLNTALAENLRSVTATFFASFSGYAVLFFTQQSRYSFANCFGNASLYQILEGYLSYGTCGMIGRYITVYIASWAVTALARAVLNRDIHK